jgi:threonine/homoserine/homoserine lactone efflux protein
VHDIDPLLAFALTAVVIEVTPGPNMTYLTALSLSNGMRTGFAAVAGIAFGLMSYGAIAAFGLAAAIDQSPLLYGALRWSGVVYLLWLAWEAWTSEYATAPEASDGSDERPWLAFRRGLITNLLNPKVAVFYIAILPEFIQPNGHPLFAQTLELSAIYVGIATVIHLGIVAMAGSLQSTISTAGRRYLIRRAFALALLGIAIWFAWTSGR